jgi:hypothetical protein
MSSEINEFTQKYLELVNDDLYLSAQDIEAIIEYETINEDNYVPNVPGPSGDKS